MTIPASILGLQPTAKAVWLYLASIARPSTIGAVEDALNLSRVSARYALETLVGVGAVSRDDSRRPHVYAIRPEPDGIRPARAVPCIPTAPAAR